ncbi:cation transporter [Pacificimonas flava]|uniref:Cation transporter n=2 Tax=Pacificimonas TaxID=1960290 RepID=A0A219B4K4_9SPHN|nr:MULTISPECIES: cation diffusion facilitator family transporter [Pacificimonas]MBZ6377602.1 cation transporter [Pacificimonas aurantium]OWV32708.1 cation transporter [Pacificimonas flava]
MGIGNDHTHEHAHSDGGHHGHDHHAPDVTARNARAVGIAALLTGGFMVAEFVGGLVSGSLALLADAGHMLTDFGALSLAWVGFRLAQRPADWKRTYGFDRFSVLVAFVNGITLFVIAGLVCWEAAERFAEPVPVQGVMMLAVAVLGLLVNLAALRLLAGGDKENLNIRAASLHVLGDLLGSVAAIAAAGVILLTGWSPIDPILSVLVALIILRGAWTVTKESAHILLEAAPPGLEGDRVVDDLEAVAGVTRIHHVHAWSISKKRPMVTLHAELSEAASSAEVKQALRTRLHDRFGVEHATIEVECSGEGGQEGCP